MADAMGIAYFAATLPLAGGVLGSSAGIAFAASSGASTLAEDPGQFKNVLILVSLPMTRTFYGLIQMMYMVLVYIPSVEITLTRALGMVGVGLLGFFAQFISAWAQGRICASGISMMPLTRGKNLMPTVMKAAFAELLGVLGIVFTILGLLLVG